MPDEGIEIHYNTPKVLTEAAVRESDYVITMGCGDECLFFPGRTRLNLPLDDPAGKDVDGVPPIRNEIKSKVEALIAEIDEKF